MNNGSHRIRPGGIFRGNIHENCGNGLRVFMLKDSLLRIEGDCRGVRVSSSEGNIWITQENDSEDHVVTEGKTFILDRSGLAIVYSLSDAKLDIRKQICPNNSLVATSCSI